MKYNSKQLECIKHPTSPLMILAGAGTGKTTTIIGRIADYIESRDIDPKSILVLTYTVNSASQLKSRLKKVTSGRSDEIMAMNFHSFGNQLLNKYYSELGYDKVPMLLDVEEIYSLIKQIIVSKSDILMSMKLRKEPFSQIKNLKSIFDRFRDELLDEDFLMDKMNQLRIQNTDDQDEQEISYQYIDYINIYMNYQKLKVDNSWIDYGDMIIASWRAVKNEKILSDYQRDIKHVVIDEFQDNNYALNEIVKHIISKTHSLTVVGDGDQSIYSFRGANLNAIDYFREHYSHITDYKEISLDINYRSSQNILDLAHSSINYNKNRIKTGPLKSNDIENGIINLLIGTRDQQAIDIRDKIVSSLKRGTDIGQIAILTRTRATAKYFSEVLDASSIKNNYKSGKLFENTCVKDMLSVMNVLAQNDNIDISLYRLIRCRFNENDCAIWFHDIKKTYRSLTNIKLGDLGKSEISEFIVSMIQKIITHEPYEFFHNVMDFCTEILDNDRSLHVQEIEHLEKMVVRYQSNNKKSVNGLIKYLNLSSEINETYIDNIEPIANEGLHIATVHKSKGLEFEDVYLPFIESSQIPIAYKKDREVYDIPIGWREGYVSMNKELHIEEERRIFHVAITRAKSNLYIYSGDKRQSIFVKELIGEDLQAIEIDGNDKLKVSDDVKYENIPLYTEKIKFSATSMETYEKCPLSYKYKYFCGLGEYKNTPHTHLGLVVHKVLESTTKDMISKYDDISSLVEQGWDSSCFETVSQSDEYKKDAISMIVEYMKVYDKSDFRDVLFEKRLSVEDNDAIYIGKCDRIDIREDGGVTIVDYKTSKRKLNQKALTENFQLNYYSFLLLKSLDKDLVNLNPGSISMIFLRHEKPEVSIDIIPENVLKIKDRMMSVVEEANKGKFVPKKGPHCNFCDYRDLLCPLYS